MLTKAIQGRANMPVQELMNAYLEAMNYRANDYEVVLNLVGGGGRLNPQSTLDECGVRDNTEVFALVKRTQRKWALDNMTDKFEDRQQLGHEQNNLNRLETDLLEGVFGVRRGNADPSAEEVAGSGSQFEPVPIPNANTSIDAGSLEVRLDDGSGVVAMRVRVPNLPPSAGNEAGRGSEDSSLPIEFGQLWNYPHTAPVVRVVRKNETLTVHHSARLVSLIEHAKLLYPAL